MTDEKMVSPALNEDEWGEGAAFYRFEGRMVRISIGRTAYDPPLQWATPSRAGILFAIIGPVGDEYPLPIIEGQALRGLIALANAALPDSDPRKVTREKLALLRQAISYAVDDDWAREPDFLPASAFLDALASYLPPDTPQPSPRR